MIALRNLFLSSPVSLASGLKSSPFAQAVRYASKKAKGASRNGRDSVGKRLGPKVMDGEYVETGNVLVRQRGTKMHPGIDVGAGRDHTLFALANGIAKFTRARPKPGKKNGVVVVSIATPPEHRAASIQRKIWKMAAKRYRGPILHAPR